MDKSETYIKMCDCPEIQNVRPDFNADGEEQNFIANLHYAKACPSHGSEHLWTKDNEHDHYCCNCGEPLVDVSHIPEIETYETNGAYKIVWLPRQDQLQDMVPIKLDKFYTLVEGFYSFFTAEHGERTMYQTLFSSMEQLWLAFVMHKKYQKQWNPSENKWVEEVN